MLATVPPSSSPSTAPTFSPTQSPTADHTAGPTARPTLSPTLSPGSSRPSAQPTGAPSFGPSVELLLVSAAKDDPDSTSTTWVTPVVIICCLALIGPGAVAWKRRRTKSTRAKTPMPQAKSTTANPVFSFSTNSRDNDTNDGRVIAVNPTYEGLGTTSTRKFKSPGNDAATAEHCPACASKLSFCICNDQETRRRTMSQSSAARVPKPRRKNQESSPAVRPTLQTLHSVDGRLDTESGGCHEEPVPQVYQLASDAYTALAAAEEPVPQTYQLATDAYSALAAEEQVSTEGVYSGSAEMFSSGQRENTRHLAVETPLYAATGTLATAAYGTIAASEPAYAGLDEFASEDAQTGYATVGSAYADAVTANPAYVEGEGGGGEAVAEYATVGPADTDAVTKNPSYVEGVNNAAPTATNVLIGDTITATAIVRRANSMYVGGGAAAPVYSITQEDGSSVT